MASSTRGRPRQEGERYPSGKLKPATEIAVPGETGRAPISGTLWQRMVENAEKVLGDARFGTELGRLCAAGQIAPSEAATGFRVAGIYGRFEYYKNLRRAAASPHYIREFIAEGAGKDTELVNFTTDIEGRERDRSFNLPDREAREREATGAFMELQAELPREFRDSVERLCVENEHVGYQGLIRARIGLAILKEYFAEKDNPSGLTSAERKKQKAKQRASLRRASAPASPGKRLDPFKQAFFSVQRAVNRHLTDEAIERMWDTLCALKARDDFRRGKREGGST